MNTTQPPLLTNGSGAQLPSPLFRARPGWGGQLREWLADNAYVIAFRLLLLAAAVLVVASLVGRHEPETALPSPTVIPRAYDAYDEVALAGEGMTHLAAKAVDDYSADQIPPLRLDAVQHLFAVDALARGAGWIRMELGDGVSFRTADIVDIVARAQSLTARQRAAWARYLAH
jgi:hypothetical protein